MKRSLWYLLANENGGDKRIEIIRTLSERPYNANQLAEQLDIHYNTVRHHLEMLEEHNVVESGDEVYGKMYYLTGQFEHHRDEFERIVEQTADSTGSQRSISTNEH